MASSGTGKLKEQNQERIYQLLRKQSELTKQDIAAQLQWSMPTTLQNVNELLERDILEECGSNESTGGRKAKRLRLNRNIGFSIGIDIAIHHVELTITDFLGDLICSQQLPIVFSDELRWYQQVGTAVQDLLATHEITEKQMICAGISFPGIIDTATDSIVRSHIFQLEHVSLDRFRRYLPYPLVVYNDANCAGFAELTQEHHSYFFVSLNETVGGAIMKDGELIIGENCQAAEFGHILLIPQGKRCYCGKNGCADAYLSPNALTSDSMSLTDYFLLLQNGERKARQVWDAYLDYLAILVTNLRMVRDSPIIIGGAVGAQIRPYMNQLCEKAAQYDLFARDIDYLYPCSVRKHACSIGAAMLALQQFGNNILQQ